MWGRRKGCGAGAVGKEEIRQAFRELMKEEGAGKLVGSLVSWIDEPGTERSKRPTANQHSNKLRRTHLHLHLPQQQPWWPPRCPRRLPR